MTIFFSADHHFCHNNIIKYLTRPFSSCVEHDQFLLNQWNTQVKPKDIVYYLGDLALGNQKFIYEKIVSKLNGQIFLIRGNHDKTSTRTLIKGRFGWIKDTDFLTLQHSGKTYEIFLSHYGHRVWPKRHYGSWHLYAHSHGNLPPYGKSFDVGIDSAKKFFGEYKMFSLDDVIDIMLNSPLTQNLK